MNYNKIVLIGIFAIVVYAIIISFSDTKLLSSQFFHIRYDFALFALGLFSAGYFIRSFRWIAMLRFMNIEIPIHRNILIYYTGYAFSLTPGKFGEAVRSKYLKDDFKIPVMKTVPTVFSERYYDVIGVVSVALFSYGISRTQSVSIFLSILLLILVYVGVKKKFIHKIFIALEKFKRLSKLGKKMVEISENVEMLLRPKIFLKCSILTITSWVVEALGAYFVFLSFGVQISVASAVFDYVVSSLIGAGSFLPGGIGGTEGSLLGLLILQGHTYDDVLSSVLLIRVLALWYVIAIGIFFTSIYKLKYGYTKHLKD